MFFFKKKKLVLDCFTNSKPAYELFKIDHAKKFYPEWWKKLPAALPNEEYPNDLTMPTMKGCPGFSDYYQKGIIIPFWSDGIIEVGEIGSTYLRVSLADPTADAQKHPGYQRGSYLPENKFTHIKFKSPWLIKGNKPVQFTMLQPMWNYEDPCQFILPPASLNFYYQNNSHINVFFKREKEKKNIRLNAGLPIIHFIPQDDIELEIKHHFVSRMEYAQMADEAYKCFYINSYNKFFKLKSNSRV